MNQFYDCGRWLDYINTQLALAQTEAESAEKRMGRLEAVSVVGSSEKITRARVEAKQEQDYMEAEDDRDMKNARRRFLRVLYENVDRQHSDLSREITRRTGRHERESRERRWGGV